MRRMSSVEPPSGVERSAASWTFGALPGAQHAPYGRPGHAQMQAALAEQRAALAAAAAGGGARSPGGPRSPGGIGARKAYEVLTSSAAAQGRTAGAQPGRMLLISSHARRMSGSITNLLVGSTPGNSNEQHQHVATVSRGTAGSSGASTLGGSGAGATGGSGTAPGGKPGALLAVRKGLERRFSALAAGSPPPVGILKNSLDPSSFGKWLYAARVLFLDIVLAHSPAL